ncbi:MAG: serine/threonine protein kinase [Gammaproteobacteria bacterium]|nr:serine/threonine protein kinase [Gammaproteobacteria bacterium]MBU1408214.1 serine/threonine protein kinase [Gammaproteobacteria bacterium]MBU1533122.1 serine/threonine protein kinase [Gammaproteobacteria bacterium]
MKIGRYEILDEIGQGAMGTVYQARDPLIERTVAIKTVSIAHLQQEGADAEARFLREAQSAGRLSHPNIVTIYDVGEADGLAYIAMEYLPGATLRDLMHRRPMPLDLTLDTVTQMAEALAFAHEHGVIHRDIKPSNVVVTGQRGRIKLTDFGIAHLVNSDHTQTGQMLGSPRYMSPEQAMGREIDGRSDIFSLGAVLYEMLTGRYAFDGDNLPAILYRVINEAPVAASSLRPRLPAGLADVLMRMLDKNPLARPDARALVDALHALAPAAPHVPAPPPANRVPRLLPVLAFGTPLGVFLLIGVSIIVIEHFLAPPPAPAVSGTPTTQDVASAPPVEGSADSRPPAKAGETASSAPEPAVASDAYLAGLDKKQVELRIRRTELLLQYTHRHPDVVQVDRQLEQLNVERRRHLRQLRKNQ